MRLIDLLPERDPTQPHEEYPTMPDPTPNAPYPNGCGSTTGSCGERPVCDGGQSAEQLAALEARNTLDALRTTVQDWLHVQSVLTSHVTLAQTLTDRICDLVGRHGLACGFPLVLGDVILDWDDTRSTVVQRRARRVG